MPQLHPLDQLTVSEVNLARTVIKSARHPHPIVVRNIVLEEPPKKKLLPYLDAENEGASLKELSNLRPPRLARCIYDVIIPAHEKETFFYDSVVDLDQRVEVEKNIVKGFHAPLSAYVFPPLPPGLFVVCC
jgi:primary-amine oxidase